MTRPLRVGSLCTGISGLELGLRLAGLDTLPVFVSDIDPGANTWLAANMPDTPNLGDFTALDELPDVDIITAGFPCQPFSAAGKRAGLTDERYLFDDIARLTSRMETRPYLFLENVPGLLFANGGDAMGRVVYGLAGIGYGIEWGTLSAAAVGAPHRRNRWWGLATYADRVAAGRHGRPAPRPQTEHDRRSKPDLGHRSTDGARARAATFGRYADAVARWETILGRPAPDPTDNKRLSPAFVEWMMGYPLGHVTDTLTNPRHSLHALGNAVVPQCAATAFQQLTARLCA
jgi:DNA (cytosine-5)-methyltransferase 1